MYAADAAGCEHLNPRRSCEHERRRNRRRSISSFRDCNPEISAGDLSHPVAAEKALQIVAL
jgi:hypothetical protein